MSTISSSPSSATSLPSLLPAPTSAANGPNVINLVSIKLDHKNYLHWKSQFLAILHTHDLVGYVDGSLKCPPQFLTQESVTTLDPAYSQWVKQDQHLASWIMATLSEPLLAQVVDPIYTSSFAIWSKLEKNLASASKLQVILLRGQLQTVKKGSSSIDHYLQSIRDLSNQLASIGSPISDNDLFYYTLGGLGPEYESSITTVSLQAEDIPFEDLSSLLRSHEVRLSSINPDLSNATTLFTSRPPSSGHPSQPRGSFPQQTGRGRGRGRGYGSSSHSPSSRPIFLTFSSKTYTSGV